MGIQRTRSRSCGAAYLGCALRSELHRRTRETGRKAPGGHTEESDEFATPGGEGCGIVGEEMASGGKHAGAGLESVAALVGLVLPGGDGEGLCPDGGQPGIDAAARLRDHRGGGRRWGRRVGVGMLAGRGRASRSVERSFTESGEPPVERGMTRRTSAQALHRRPQSWPREVGRDVRTGSLLDDGEAERLVRQQLRGQDSSGPPARRASGEGDPQAMELGFVSPAEQHRPPCRPDSAEGQAATGATVAAAQRGRQRRSFGRRAEQARIVAGKRNRDSCGSRKGIGFRRLRVFETRSLIPLSSIPTTDRCAESVENRRLMSL